MGETMAWTAAVEEAPQVDRFSKPAVGNNLFCASP